MKKEEFKALAVDIKPLIEDMTEVLKMHKVEGLAGVTFSTDGYCIFSVHSSDWEMYRLNYTEPVQIHLNILEEL